MTLHTGIDGSAPPAPGSAGPLVTGRDLGGEDRRARLPEPSHERANWRGNEPTEHRITAVPE